MNEKAEIQSQWFGRTIILSDRRFAYEEAQKVIDTGEGDFKDEILTLHKLAQTLRAERYKKGSISFERDEVKFEIDERGKPLRVFYKIMGESNQLIEEFMLLANKKVAEFCSGVITVDSPPRKGKGKTMVYRIHDQPNVEKLNSFASFVTKFGYKISTVSAKKISESLNNLWKRLKGRRSKTSLKRWLCALWLRPNTQQ
jgi:ribonuclease R